MMKDRGRRVVGPGLASEGDHLFREVERLPACAEDRGSGTRAPGAAVGQKAAQRTPVTAQDRGGEIGLRSGGQTLDQVFDEPGRGEQLAGEQTAR